jgi:ferredoxin
MTYIIDDGCILCGICEGSCPTGAIMAGDDSYFIDPDACIDCGACEGSCPSGVIKPE